jgi:hypothetical protein
VDGLKTGVALLLLLAAVGCGRSERPWQLLDGGGAAEFRPVRGSVLTVGRTTRRATLGARVDDCLLPSDRASVGADALVVERVGVDGESLTFASGGGVYACDGGSDRAGERSPPWCGTVFGERAGGRILDPRLDVNCRDRRGMPLAYAFVDPVAGAHWIGVVRDGYVEVYEALAGLPVRIVTTSRIAEEEARATFEITQYDLAGRELVRAELEAAVAG